MQSLLHLVLADFAERLVANQHFVKNVYEIIFLFLDRDVGLATGIAHYV